MSYVNEVNKRKYADPEYIAISELLSSIGEVDEYEASHHEDYRAGGGIYQNASGGFRKRSKNGGISRSDIVATLIKKDGNNKADKQPDSAQKRDAVHSEVVSSIREGNLRDYKDQDPYVERSDRGRQQSKHSRLTELEEHVRELERQNLYLKQTMLLSTPGSVISGGSEKESGTHVLSERTKIVQEMVEQLNSPCLSLGDASRVWHQDCRIGVGVRDWDAFGRLQTISLWNLIRSVFATIAVDIVELRPHLPDGEMILTKWRIQGEIASPAHLDSVCSSEDCPVTMKVALMAIKSSDLTFTVTTYVIFQDCKIAEQHHCWDQVGVFKRLFGGEIPSSVREMLAIK